MVTLRERNSAVDYTSRGSTGGTCTPTWMKKEEARRRASVRFAPESFKVRALLTRVRARARAHTRTRARARACTPALARSRIWRTRLT